MTNGGQSAQKAPWRCRLFGHRLIDPLTGQRAPDFFVPSAENYRGPVVIGRCARCPHEWRSA